jgi:hypothetical protein
MGTKLSIQDQMDYDWMTDMFDTGQEMVISQIPNFEGAHVVKYGAGASKLVSHAVWLKYEATKHNYT